MPYFNLATAITAPALIGVALGLTAGLAPASAAPQPSPGVTLGVTIDPANPANYVVRVQGKFPMSEGDAYDRLDHLGPGGGMDYTVYADDPGENDGPIGIPHGFIGRPGPPGGSVLATPAGLAFFRDISVPKSDLNEDDGTDEIYVRVRFVSGNGAGDLRANSEAISADF
jgi:hypothetical protein